MYFVVNFSKNQKLFHLKILSKSYGYSSLRVFVALELPSPVFQNYWIFELQLSQYVFYEFYIISHKLITKQVDKWINEGLGKIKPIANQNSSTKLFSQLIQCSIFVGYVDSPSIQPILDLSIQCWKRRICVMGGRKLEWGTASIIWSRDSAPTITKQDGSQSYTLIFTNEGSATKVKF